MAVVPVVRAFLLATLVGFGVSGLRSHAAEARVANSKASEKLTVTFSADARRLEIAAAQLSAQSYELRIVTDGLSKPETGNDVNEPGIIYLPPQPDAGPGSQPVAENVFFFNELRDAPNWELVMRFDVGRRGTWKLNGRFSPLGGEIAPELVIPVGELEHGENLLHIRGADLGLPQMYFRRSYAAGEPISASLSLGPRDWSGRVVLLAKTAAGEREVNAQTVESARSHVSSPSLPEDWWQHRQRLTEAALAVGRNLLSARIERSGSIFNGGFNLVYDPSRKSPRIEHWMWAWGPSVDLLLRLSKLEAAKAGGLAAQFRAAALAAADRTLTFPVSDPTHPAFGVSTVRWEPSRATPQGWAEYIATSDSLFMAGWGWMSAYHETHDAVYLDRMKSLVAAAERMMGQYPVIPQDWIVERNRWTPHTLDESVFGTIGFRRLYEVTKSPEVAAAGRRYLESHLTHMGREDGLLARGWMRDENKDIWDPDIKGHAWVIEGYLDAHRLSGDAKYLELARQLTKRVLACQAADGSWTYLFKRPAAGDPIDDKGTAIWAYLLYDLYRSTNDAEHLAAARKALGWCLRHQYRGEDPNLDGAILHENGMAYVRRRPMTILYTTTFFGLALLEELALSDGTPGSN